MRSLAAESDRAYKVGPLERTFYEEARLTPEEGGEEDMDAAGFELKNQYDSRLDWFAVDLEGEHSAMDSAVLEQHTQYVVHCIHRVDLSLSLTHSYTNYFRQIECGLVISQCLILEFILFS